MAGIAGFKRDVQPANASAMLLRDWVENDTFTWIMTAEILEEYAAVLAALRVRPSVIGRVINLLREEAEWVEPRRTVEADPDPGDSPFWTCAESADADFVVTLNRRDFPQIKLRARILGPGDAFPSAHRRKVRRRRVR